MLIYPFTHLNRAFATPSSSFGSTSSRYKCGNGIYYLHCQSSFFLYSGSALLFFFFVVKKEICLRRSNSQTKAVGKGKKRRKKGQIKGNTASLSSNTYSRLHHSLLSTLSASSRTATRFILPGGGQLLHALVIAGKTMDAGLYKNETVLRIAVLRVAL